MSSLEPTAGRIRTLDVLRGVAILGIVPANIYAFAGPAFSEFYGGASGTTEHVGWADALLLAFVNGKFRSTLAILFGIGLALQFAKRSAAGDWPMGYVKRTAILGLIGILHAVVIWWGDILFTYAVMALIAMVLVQLPSKMLALIAAGLGALTLLFALVIALMSSVMDGGSSSLIVSASEEARIFAEGTFLEQLQLRLLFFGFTAMVTPFLLPGLLPLFLLGILFARSGLLFEAGRGTRARALALYIGLGVGLPLNLWVLVFLPQGAPSGVHMLIEFVCAPVLAVGLAAAVATWSERSPGFFSRVLERVGRLALSNYLLQSIVGSLLFYSFGLGLHGDLNNAEALSFVPLVWLVNVAFTLLWTRGHAMGPVEWLWRRLAEGRAPTPAEAR